MNQVRPYDKWPTGDGRPIGVLRLEPAELSSRYGLRFERDVDDLDEYELAAIAVPGGQVWLVRYQRAPQQGTEVRADVGDDPGQRLDDVLRELGLPSEVVTWSLVEAQKADQR